MPTTRYCTRVSKIHPTEDYLGNDECCIYYGIRADEQRAGYNPGRRTNLHPIYPLQEEGYTLPMVWELVSSQGLLPPAFFWKEIYERVVKQLGELAGIIDKLKPWERQILFSWRSRPNCHICFFQRMYEWIGLLEHHPDLFWKNAQIEKEIGSAQFTLMRGRPLPSIAERAEQIKQRRVKDICKILARLAQTGIFGEGEDEAGETPDILHVVSCGLFCGK